MNSENDFAPELSGNPSSEPTSELLFVYGTLQPKFGLSRDDSKAIHDAIHADLFDLGEYPGAINIGRSTNSIIGQIISVSVEELNRFDRYEGVDDGLYRRVRTRSKSGIIAWVYEYSAELPINAVAIEKWTIDPEDLALRATT